MQNPLITVVIPVYNAEKYLKKCIESVVEQTYKNIEILVIDDGSTDSSLTIANEFLVDPRIIIIQKANGGLSSARQAGIDNAKGEFLCTIDSDDWVELDFIEKLYDKISLDNSDICVCAVIYHEKGKKKKVGFTDDYSDQGIKYSTNEVEANYRQLLKKYYMTDSWNKIYRLSFIEKTGVKFTLNKGYIGTDLLFNYLLFLHRPKISTIDDYLYNYQLLEGSITRKKDKKLQEGFMYIVDKLIIEAKKLKYSSKIYKQFSMLYVDYIYMAAVDICNQHKFHQFKIPISKLFLTHKKFMLNNTELNVIITRDNKLTLNIMSFCLNKKNEQCMIIFLVFKEIIEGIRNKFIS